MIDGISASPAATDESSSLYAANKITQKPFAKLAIGDEFFAEIVDIKPGTVKIMLNDASTLTARVLTMPDARINDIARFLVVDKVNSAIVLEFVKNFAINSTKSHSIIQEALFAANMQHTEESAQLILNLIKNNMPIDSKTLQQAAFFSYSMPDAPFSDIVFLLENNFLPTEKNVNIFQAFKNHTALPDTSITGQEIIDFCKNIEHNKTFMPFAFPANDKNTPAELHVFKDKNKKIDGKNASALLALDTAFLGRLEIFIQKHSNEVSLQFGSDKSSSLATVKVNSNKLAELLSDKGYSITGLNYKIIDEKFSIVDTKDKKEIPPEISTKNTRYSFDMRV